MPRARKAASGGARRLREYHAKRDFARTPEPSGHEPPAAQPRWSFVVQKHAARRLHYDFRLELDGVLLSWSVPKGPSLSPTVRRLSVRTEDHPLSYADFEGIIPAGEYGGGTVVVWDRGTWEPEGDPHQALRKGRLTFTLRGEKLRGRWHLVRTRLDAEKAENWLLFKSRDDEASDTRDLVTERPESVLTGRTIEEVKEAKDRVWHSNRPAGHAAATDAPPQASAAASSDVHDLVSALPLGVPLTNLDKILYPEQGLTKGQLIAYLAVIADWLLPHAADRPLTIVRCPDGRHKCFYQKHARAGVPDVIGRVAIAEDDGTAEYMTIRDLAGLIALAQLGTLEIHTWGCHTDKIERPDLLVFDLDPDPDLAWDVVVDAALRLRRRLDDLGLVTFVKTTGGKGLHVVAPIERRIEWDDFKAFARAVTERIAEEDPDRYVTSPLKARRKGKIFLDYLRNSRGATFIAPYSPRARAGATVATPITWEELSAGVDPAAFDVTSVPRRLGALSRDPWDGFHDLRQTITATARRSVGSGTR